VFADHLPKYPVVTFKEIDVAVLELLEEKGRPLDIGEQERDGAS